MPENSVCALVRHLAEFVVTKKSEISDNRLPASTSCRKRYPAVRPAALQAMPEETFVGRMKYQDRGLHVLDEMTGLQKTGQWGIRFFPNENS